VAWQARIRASSVGLCSLTASGGYTLNSYHQPTAMWRSSEDCCEIGVGGRRTGTALRSPVNAAGDLRCDVNLRGFEMAYLRGAAHHQGVCGIKLTDPFGDTGGRILDACPGWLCNTGVRTPDACLCSLRNTGASVLGFRLCSLRYIDVSARLHT